MASVTFNLAAFRARYPEFSGVADGTLAAYFDEATLYCNNTAASLIRVEAQRSMLLNMLVAHIAFLVNGGAPRPVGRTSSATEGSVNVGLEYAVPGTAAWYAQSQYGAAYWQATLTTRAFRYIPGPRACPR